MLHHILLESAFLQLLPLFPLVYLNALVLYTRPCCTNYTMSKWAISYLLVTKENRDVEIIYIGQLVWWRGTYTNSLIEQTQNICALTHNFLSFEFSTSVINGAYPI